MSGSRLTRKVTVEGSKQTNDSNAPRKSVFDRLGPGTIEREYCVNECISSTSEQCSKDNSALTSSATETLRSQTKREDHHEPPVEKCRHWLRDGRCPFGNKCRYNHGSTSGAKSKLKIIRSIVSRHVDESDFQRSLLTRLDTIVEKQDEALYILNFKSVVLVVTSMMKVSRGNGPDREIFTAGRRTFLRQRANISLSGPTKNGESKSELKVKRFQNPEEGASEQSSKRSSKRQKSEKTKTTKEHVKEGNNVKEPRQLRKEKEDIKVEKRKEATTVRRNSSGWNLHPDQSESDDGNDGKQLDWEERGALNYELEERRNDLRRQLAKIDETVETGFTVPSNVAVPVVHCQVTRAVEQHSSPPFHDDDVGGKPEKKKKAKSEKSKKKSKKKSHKTDSPLQTQSEHLRAELNEPSDRTKKVKSPALGKKKKKQDNRNDSEPEIPTMEVPNRRQEYQKEIPPQDQIQARRGDVPRGPTLKDQNNKGRHSHEPSREVRQPRSQHPERHFSMESFPQFNRESDRQREKEIKFESNDEGRNKEKERTQKRFQYWSPSLEGKEVSLHREERVGEAKKSGTRRIPVEERQDNRKNKNKEKAKEVSGSSRPSDEDLNKGAKTVNRENRSSRKAKGPRTPSPAFKRQSASRDAGRDSKNETPVKLTRRHGNDGEPVAVSVVPANVHHSPPEDPNSKPFKPSRGEKHMVEQEAHENMSESSDSESSSSEDSVEVESVSGEEQHNEGSRVVSLNVQEKATEHFTTESKQEYRDERRTDVMRNRGAYPDHEEQHIGDPREQGLNEARERPLGEPREPTLEEPRERPLKEHRERPLNEPRERPLNVSRERPLNEPRGRPLNEPRERPLNEPRECPLNEPRERPLDEPRERPLDEPRERPLNDSRERSLNEPRERPLNERRERSLNEPRERPLDEPRERPLDEPRERPLDEPRERPLDEPRERSLNEPRERPLNEPRERPLNERRERSLNEPRQRPLDEPRERPLDESRERSLNEPRERPLNEPRERPLNEPRERPLNEPRERPLDEPRERPLKEPRERPLNEPRERPLNEPRERPLDEPRERPLKEPRERTLNEPRERPLNEPRERPLDEPRERPLKEPRERPLNEPRDRPLNESRERPSNEPRERPLNEPRERPLNELRERPLDEPRERPLKEPRERPLNESRERPSNESRERPLNEPRERPPNELRERPLNESRERPLDEPRERPLDEPKERPLNEPRERPFDEPRERPLNEPRERPLDDPRERPLNEPRERPLDEPRERSLDEPRECPLDEPRPLNEHRERTLKEPRERPSIEPSRERPLDDRCDPKERPSQYDRNEERGERYHRERGRDNRRQRDEDIDRRADNRHSKDTREMRDTKDERDTRDHREFPRIDHRSARDRERYREFDEREKERHLPVDVRRNEAPRARDDERAGYGEGAWGRDRHVRGRSGYYDGRGKDFEERRPEGRPSHEYDRNYDREREFPAKGSRYREGNERAPWPERRVERSYREPERERFSESRDRLHDDPKGPRTNKRPPRASPEADRNDRKGYREEPERRPCTPPEESEEWDYEEGHSPGTHTKDKDPSSRKRPKDQPSPRSPRSEAPKRKKVGSPEQVSQDPPKSKEKIVAASNEQAIDPKESEKQHDKESKKSKKDKSKKTKKRKLSENEATEKVDTPERKRNKRDATEEKSREKQVKKPKTKNQPEVVVRPWSDLESEVDVSKGQGKNEKDGRETAGQDAAIGATVKGGEEKKDAAVFSDWSDASENAVLTKVDTAESKEVNEKIPELIEDGKEEKQNKTNDPDASLDDVYDPISDDEFEAMFGGEEQTVVKKKTTPLPVDEVDWSILGSSVTKKESVPGDYIKRFLAGKVFSRIGLSSVLAGAALTKLVREKCAQDAPDMKMKDLLPNGSGEKSTLGALVAAEARKIKERSNVVNDIGPCRRALCARRDFYIRKQLRKLTSTKLGAKLVLSNSTVEPVDNELFAMSVALFQRRKSEFKQETKVQSALLPDHSDVLVC